MSDTDGFMSGVEISDAVSANAAASTATKEFLQVGIDSCNNASHPNFTIHFWENVRDYAMQQVGEPSKSEEKKIKPLSDDKAKTFAKLEVPRGKYAEEKFSVVYYKDADYLRTLSQQLEFWQHDLQAWLVWADEQPPETFVPKAKKTPAKIVKSESPPAT